MSSYDELELDTYSDAGSTGKSLKSLTCLSASGLVLSLCGLAVSTGVLFYVRKTSNDGLTKMDGALATMDANAPKVPLLPGVFQTPGKRKIILAQDIDYPPYAYLGVPPESDYDVAGLGHDIAQGLPQVCPDLEIVTLQTPWSGCWNQGAIGTRLANGEYHGCMTYTHTAGERNRHVEFSDPILQMNKAAGILVRLKADGAPEIDGNSLLTGKKVVDVTGWAPTADTLALVTNKCNNQRFTGFTMVGSGTDADKNQNDVALTMLLANDGSADAAWLYADQVAKYVKECKVVPKAATTVWNCDNWQKFGKPNGFAYIQTGLMGHAIAGTTLTMSKKGSGLPLAVNPCLKKFMATKQYYDICEKHKVTEGCFPNSFFPASSVAPTPDGIPTNKLTTACTDGYCPCPTR